MVYTVGEMARLLGITASTLRYYDREGLLPFVERSPGGVRMFRDSDVEWLRVIGCMKQAGMSIRDIREMVEYKCWYYETAKAAGSMSALKEMKESDIPERFRRIRGELRGAARPPEEGR